MWLAGPCSLVDSGSPSPTGQVLRTSNQMPSHASLILSQSVSSWHHLASFLHGWSINLAFQGWVVLCSREGARPRLRSPWEMIYFSVRPFLCSTEGPWFETFRLFPGEQDKFFADQVQQYYTKIHKKTKLYLLYYVNKNVTDYDLAPLPMLFPA